MERDEASVIACHAEKRLEMLPIEHFYIGQSAGRALDDLVRAKVRTRGHVHRYQRVTAPMDDQRRLAAQISTDLDFVDPGLQLQRGRARRGPQIAQALRAGVGEIVVSKRVQDRASGGQVVK